jgi:hypothetical protein
MNTPPSLPRYAKGMSLLELTVVIAVVLALIGIVLIGSSAWKRGADRSGCIMNIRNTQNAVRAHQNLRALADGMAIDISAEIIGPGKMIESEPECPGGGGYTRIDHLPYQGELAMTCDLSSSELHVPNGHADW